MKLILKNKETDVTKTVKIGPALYILIPYANIVINIIRKQFKPFLSFSIFIIIFYMAYIFIAIILIAIGLPTIIIIIAFLAVVIFFDVKFIIGLNYWSYNKYIEDGYELVNFEDQDVKNFIIKAENHQKPKWIFFI